MKASPQYVQWVEEEEEEKGEEEPVGQVGGFDGKGDEDFTEYRPTGEELSVLARHWAGKSLNEDLFRFYYQMSCWSYTCNQIHAEMRLKTIAEVIGEEAVQQARDWVAEKERNRMGEEHWRIFTEGTEEEWDAFADEVNRNMTNAAASKPAKPDSDK